MYKTLIVEDEKKAQNALTRILNNYCENINVIGYADNVKSAVEQIDNMQPDIVYMDIELSDGTGFEVLSQISNMNFSLIFCTGHNEFAIQAFKYNAIDYILKPPDIEEVISSTNKAIDNLNLKQKDTAFKHLLSFYQNADKVNEKIILKTSSDIYIILIQDIYHCESDGSYTTFNTIDDRKITVSKSLKEYESILNTHNFIRPHQSHLVNLNYVQRIHKADGGYLVLKNGKEIPISTRKKESIIKALDNMMK